MKIYNTFIIQIPILIQNLISLPIPITNTKIKPLPYLVPDSTPKNKIGTHPTTNSPKTDAPNQFKDEKDLFHGHALCDQTGSDHRVQESLAAKMPSGGCHMVPILQLS